MYVNHALVLVALKSEITVMLFLGVCVFFMEAHCKALWTVFSLSSWHKTLWLVNGKIQREKDYCLQGNFMESRIYLPKEDFSQTTEIALCLWQITYIGLNVLWCLWSFRSAAFLSALAVFGICSSRSSLLVGCITGLFKSHLFPLLFSKQYLQWSCM